MSAIHIGGHTTPEGSPGLEVVRENDRIVKRAFNPSDAEGLRREGLMLQRLAPTGYAPKLLEYEEGRIVEEDLGDGQPIQDGEKFRRECIYLLDALHSCNVRHGDLTQPNIIVRDDRPYAIDFQQSNFYDEGPPQKRPLSDSYFLYRWAAEQYDTPRVLRRWLAVLGDLGGYAPTLPLRERTLLDLGCYAGDFCGLAAVEGMRAVGVDTGHFTTEIDSIAEAGKLWDKLHRIPTFRRMNIMEVEDFSFDVVLLFSTWAYICNDYGREEAFELLNRITKACGVLYFETQLAGDGPGPDFLLTEDDVANMLGQFGVPTPLATISVAGREAARTVWKVHRSI